MHRVTIQTPDLSDISTKYNCIEFISYMIHVSSVATTQLKHMGPTPFVKEYTYFDNCVFWLKTRLDFK